MSDAIKKLKKISKKELSFRNRIINGRKIYKMLMEKYDPNYIKMKIGCRCKMQEIYCIQKKIRKKSRPCHPLRQGKKSKIQKQYLDKLKEIMQIEKNCFLSSKLILEKWLKLCQIDKKYVKARNFRNILHKELNFSFKKSTTHKPRTNNIINKGKRRDFVLIMIKEIDQNMKFIFLDETSFNMEGKKCYGWSLKGEILSLEAKNRSCNYSLIAAMTQSRLIGFMIVRRYVNGVAFLGFIMMLLNHLIIEEKNKIEDYAFVLDNASIHKKYLENNKIEKNLKIIWTPPYSPQMNPIEMIWSQWKKKVYKFGGFICEDDLIYAIAMAAIEMRNYNYMGAFIHGGNKKI